MKTIWKYPVHDWIDELWMPRGAKVLLVAEQAAVINLWAEVDTAADHVRRGVAVIGTGLPLPQGRGSHVGTVVVGEYVWHLYLEDEPYELDPRVFGPGDPADEYADPARPS